MTLFQLPLRISLPFILILWLSFFVIADCIGQTNQNVIDTDITHTIPAVSNENKAKIISDTPIFSGKRLIDLPIETAVMAALQNNRDLRIQRLEPVKAGTFESIEQAAFDPEIFAALSYAKEKAIDTLKTESATLGLRKTFATGTTLETEITRERDRSEISPEDQHARISLSLTQSLLKGFGTSVNLARVKQAALNTAASLEELKGFIETLVADTEIAYWQYLLAKQKIAIFEQSLAIAETQRDEIELQILVGSLPKTEAAAARSEVALREQGVIDAVSLLEEHRLKLIYLISSGNGEQFDQRINLTSKPDIETLPVANLSERVQLAEKSRSDLNEARVRLEENRLETIITRNGILPRLDLFITLGRTGYAGTFPDTLQSLENNGANDFQLGVKFNHVLGNRASKAKNKAALSTGIQAKTAVENLLTLIQLDVRLAVNEVERTRKQIKATRTTRLFQEQTYAAEKERFDVGSSTILLVAQAQRDLLAARIAEVNAIVYFRIALVRLYLAEGSILAMRGIKV